MLEDGGLESAVKEGAASPEFTKLCAWIVSELRLYCKLEENVHATNCKQRVPRLPRQQSSVEPLGAGSVRGSARRTEE